MDVDVHIVDIVGHDSYSRQVHSYDKPVGCNANPNNTMIRPLLVGRTRAAPQGLKLQVVSNLDGVEAYKSVPLSITS